MRLKGRLRFGRSVAYFVVRSLRSCALGTFSFSWACPRLSVPYRCWVYSPRLHTAPTFIFRVNGYVRPTSVICALSPPATSSWHFSPYSANSLLCLMLASVHLTAIIYQVCMKSGVAFGMTQSRHYCSSCGRVFVLEHCNRRVPLPHHGFEQVSRKKKLSELKKKSCRS